MPLEMWQEREGLSLMSRSREDGKEGLIGYDRRRDVSSGVWAGGLSVGDFVGLVASVSMNEFSLLAI